MKFDFRRFITAQLIAFILFSSGFILGSFLTYQAIDVFLDSNYICYPLGLK